MRRDSSGGISEPANSPKNTICRYKAKVGNLSIYKGIEVLEAVINQGAPLFPELVIYYGRKESQFFSGHVLSSTRLFLVLTNRPVLVPSSTVLANRELIMLHFLTFLSHRTPPRLGDLSPFYCREHRFQCQLTCTGWR
jgi:hypothetical protein